MSIIPLSARGTSCVFAVAFFTWLIGLVAPSVVGADVFNVNTTLDGGNGVCEGMVVGDCTLRDAVTDAADGDTINVPDGTFVLAQPGGELVLDEDITVVGAGARATTVTGNGTSRVIRAINTNGSTTIAVSGMTLTAGNGVGVDPGLGGALYVGSSTTLSLTDSAVTNSSARLGGGIYTDGNLQLSRVTVFGNQANGTVGGPPGAGGGVYHDSDNDPVRIVVISTSTISGNSTSGNGGGVFSNDGILALQSTTIADNTAVSGSGLFKPGSGTALQDTIIAASSGAACAGAGVAQFTGSNNLATDGTCLIATAADPLLGTLTNNGGSTDTHALGANSPAIGTASPAANRCTGTDQRGVARPQAGACDIGAFEYVAPTLTVTTTIINNDGGNDAPADFTVHVRDAANAEVGGSPQPGSATGTAYTLAPGSFRVAADGANQYSIAIGGACAADGSVTLAESQAVTCTVTANDRQPRAGREVAAMPVRGTVRIKKPGGRFRIMREGDILPNGTIVDTLKGRITLIAPANRSGRETRADFYDGIFKLRQSKGRRPTTTLTLIEKLRCPKAGTATISAKRKKKRRLWGDGSGRFRTKGKHSAATVVGTKWLVEDRCRSTLTRVVRGRVSVRDFVKKKTVIVRRGKRYVAKARK